MKKIRRDWLKRRIEAGVVEAKCNYVLTDDYGFDNAYNFQKSDWMPVRISRPEIIEYVNDIGSRLTRIGDPDSLSGYLNLREYVFTMCRAWTNEDGTISFTIAGNESYTLRIKAEAK